MRPASGAGGALRRLARRLLGLAGAGGAGLAAGGALALAVRLAARRAAQVRSLSGLPGRPACRGAGPVPHALSGPALLEGRPFADTLRHWGIAEADLPGALAFWRLEALAGIALACFALCSLAAGMRSGAGAGAAGGGLAATLAWHLAGFAKASMAMAGIVLSLGACWRRAVARRRRFVPFASWLCRWR